MRGKSVVLAKPQTFMNLIGPAVKGCSKVRIDESRFDCGVRRAGSSLGRSAD